MRVFLGLAAAAVSLALTARSLACAVCATADPSLTSAGTEQAYRGRLRSTVDFRTGWVVAGAPGAAEVRVDDRRIELATTYAPDETLALTLGIPALARTIDTAGAAAVDRVTLGDVEMRLSDALWTSTSGGIRQRMGLLGAVKLPTAPLERDAAGAPLSSVLQPGCGSIVPAFGAFYALSRGAFGGYASASVWLPFAVRSGPHAGDSLRASASLQWQPARAFALRGGPMLRMDTSGELEDGTTDPSSGGIVGYASLEAVTSPVPDLVVSVGGLYPAAQALRGDHREGPIALATVGYDF